MKLGESVSNYFSQVMIIVSNMQIYRHKTKDITIIEKILLSFTPKFIFVFYAIEESKDIIEISLDELQSSLRVLI